MALLRKTFDVTAFTKIVDDVPGYIIKVAGISFSNQDSTSRIYVSLFDSGINYLYGGSGQDINLHARGAQFGMMPINTDNPYFSVEEGEDLYIYPYAAVRISGILYYYKVSTAGEEATSEREAKIIGKDTAF